MIYQASLLSSTESRLTISQFLSKNRALDKDLTNWNLSYGITDGGASGAYGSAEILEAIALWWDDYSELAEKIGLSRTIDEGMLEEWGRMFLPSGDWLKCYLVAHAHKKEVVYSSPDQVRSMMWRGE
jgi:hypothetical protein